MVAAARTLGAFAGAGVADPKWRHGVILAGDRRISGWREIALDIDDDVGSPDSVEDADVTTRGETNHHEICLGRAGVEADIRSSRLR